MEQDPGVCTRCSSTYSWVKPPVLAWGAPRSQAQGHHRDSPAACDPSILQHLCEAHHDPGPGPAAPVSCSRDSSAPGSPLPTPLHFKVSARPTQRQPRRTAELPRSQEEQGAATRRASSCRRWAALQERSLLWLGSRSWPEHRSPAGSMSRVEPAAFVEGLRSRFVELLQEP